MLAWDDLRFVLALARAGSVRAAGTALDVSHSTVARRIEAFEKVLGAKLFDRSRQGYALTLAGQRLLATAEKMEAEVAAVERDVLAADDRMEGPAHLTCWDSHAAELLLPALASFSDTHPGVELHLTADPRSVSLTLREADVALRVMAPHDGAPEHLMGRKLVPMAVASYVSVAHGDPRNPEVEGSAPRWLAYDNPTQLALLIAGSAYPEVPMWGSFATLELMAAATRAGLGIGMLPCYVGDADPCLRRLHQPDVRRVADVWLLSHPDLRTNARLKALRGCVQDAMTHLRPLYAGSSPRA